MDRPTVSGTQFTRLRGAASSPGPSQRNWRQGPGDDPGKTQGRNRRWAPRFGHGGGRAAGAVWRQRACPGREGASQSPPTTHREHTLGPLAANRAHSTRQVRSHLSPIPKCPEMDEEWARDRDARRVGVGRRDRE